LTVGIQYKFKLDAHDGRGTGSSQADILLNAAPTSGTVSVSPTEGQAVTDTFAIVASGWVDEDLPLLYTFGYMESAETEVLLSTAASSPSVSAVLPAGAEEDDHGYSVTVSVSDSYAAAARRTAIVRVRPYEPAASSTMMTDATELLDVAATNDNSEQATQLVTAFAASLNTGNTAADADAQAEAAEMRSLLATALLNTIADTQGAGDQEEDEPVEISNEMVAMLGQSLASVSAKPDEMTTESLETSFAAVETLTASTTAVVSTAAVESLAAATSNLCVATTSLKARWKTQPRQPHSRNRLCRLWRS